MAGPVDAYYFTDQAKRCRRLAKAADERTREALIEIAAEYEAKAIELDEQAHEK